MEEFFYASRAKRGRGGVGVGVRLGVLVAGVGAVAVSLEVSEFSLGLSFQLRYVHDHNMVIQGSEEVATFSGHINLH